MTDALASAFKHHGMRLILLIERLGLLVVLAATLLASAQEVSAMLRAHQVGVTDILLLFIYLEIITMSAVYWRVGRLPVRMPLYIAMVALARHITLDTQEFQPLAMLAEASAILLLGVAVLIVRYGHVRFPYTDEGDREPLS